MKSRQSRGVAVFAIVLGLTGGAGAPARAQYFSNRDGYAQNGVYRVQVELDPYPGWPGGSGSVHFAVLLASGRTPGNFNAGLLGPAGPAQTRQAAAIGAGVVRDGPYATEMDLQYLPVRRSDSLLMGPQGGGYRVDAGAVSGIPAAADARPGLAGLAIWRLYAGEGVLAGRVAGGNTGFGQSWAGGRGGFVATPRGRADPGAGMQGFGAGDGAWGWGASGGIAYAMTGWATLNIGARVLKTEWLGLGRTAFGQRRSLPLSLSLVTYGPMIGVGLRF